MDRSGGGLRAHSRRGRIGRTWWSERWTSVLESIGMGDRLHRGRSLARAGSIRSLELSEGEVAAAVTGARQETHQVRIAMEPISSRDWDAVQEILARRALFAAHLLAGEMPQPIEEAFAEAGLSLFPAEAAELEVECDCSDPARPCPHAAAVMYLLAERFDEDPFLIFLFRGRGRAELLEAIKQVWAQVASASGDGASVNPAAISAPAALLDGNGETAGDQAQAGEGAVNAVLERDEEGAPLPLAARAAATEAGRPKDEVPEDVLDGFWDLRANLEPLNPRITAPAIPEAVVRRLGPPPGAAADSSAEAALRRAYQVASRWALGLASKEGTEEV